MNIDIFLFVFVSVVLLSVEVLLIVAVLFSLNKPNVKNQPTEYPTQKLSQLEQVRKFMSDGEWHSLREISTAIKAPASSVSARLRDLRKPKFGGHSIEKRQVKNAYGKFFVYKMTKTKTSKRRAR